MVIQKIHHRRLALLAGFAISLLFVSHFWSRGYTGTALTDVDVHTRTGSAVQQVYNADRRRPGDSEEKTKTTPKITVIAIWSHYSDADEQSRKAAGESQDEGRYQFGAGNTAHYMPMFFQSVEANPEVDLLFIDVDRDSDKHEARCTSYTKAANVKHVCLAEREYYELHADFLCKRWNCVGKDREFLIQRFKSERDGDRSNSFFRTLRSGIFAEWIDPQTTIWGWCDSDTYWGSFARNFPWDVAYEFDIIAPTSYPSYGDQHLLFTRGHLAFFRHSDEVLERLHSYPHFSSLASYLLTPQVDVAAEESEFSQYYFHTDSNFTFMTIEGMVDTGGMLAVLSDRGVFYAYNQEKSSMVPSTRQNLLSLVEETPPRSPAVQTTQLEPTFSHAGIEMEMEIKHEGYKAGIWFPDEFTTYFEPGWTHDELRDNKAFFMRRRAGGPTSGRLEPRLRHLRVAEDESILVGEGLYKHFQAEKRKGWFYEIPLPQNGQFYAQYGVEEGQLWGNDGAILVSSDVE